MRPLALIVLIIAGLVTPRPGFAQAVTDRTPNLSGGWVASPGTLQFNFLHRFWIVEAGDDDKMVNTPTMLLAVPLRSRVTVGAQYATNSLVTAGRFNEWELYGRWALRPPGDGPLGTALTAAYNSAARSGDAELSATLAVPGSEHLPLGPIRLMGAGRYFSDAFGSGAAGWSAGGGVILDVREGLRLAGDIGTVWLDGEREDRVWGAALQLRIPTTPHTLSLQATNTRTGTLQGSTRSARTLWGFEFTVPITLARYLPRRPSEDAGAVAPAGVDDVEVTMTTDLRYVPERIEIEVGRTVAWRNTSPLMHTVTADPSGARNPDMIRLPPGAEPFDSGEMLPGDVFRHTFLVPGEYLYVCAPHDMAGMVGTVVVVPRR